MEGTTVTQEKWLIDEEKTLDFEAVRSVKVSLIGGQVNIVGHDEPGARVEVHSVRGKALKVSIDGDRLEIDHPQIGWENFVDVFTSFSGRASADLSIMVPRDAALKFGAVNANTLVSGLTSDATVSTVNGDLVIDSVQGDLQLNSVNGEINVRGHHGAVAVKTVNGDVTVSGEIVRFSCDGVVGSVFLDIAGVPDSIRVNTVSGHLTARLEAGVAVRYTISTVAGKLQLDDSEITGVHGTYNGKFGALDKHWIDFKTNSVSGSVSVLHAVHA